MPDGQVCPDERCEPGLESKLSEVLGILEGQGYKTYKTFPACGRLVTIAIGTLSAPVK